jgi:hypothetical protein
MLTSLICASGLYCGVGGVVNMVNKYMVKINMVYTLKGKLFLVKPNLLKEGIFCKISEPNIKFNSDGEICNHYYHKEHSYTFKMENMPYINNTSNVKIYGGSTLYLNNPTSIKTIQQNPHLETIINKTLVKMPKLDYSDILKTGDVYYVADKHNNSIMLSINPVNFRNDVLQEYKIEETPWVFVLFLLLVTYKIISYFMSYPEEEECKCKRCQ